MNEEEINKMCSDIYEGEDWQPMKDYIKSLQTQLQQKENIIKEVREYITSYESISTIQGLENIKNNKDLDEKTLNEMVRRYMMVHDKILEILKGEDKE